MIPVKPPHQQMVPIRMPNNREILAVTSRVPPISNIVKAAKKVNNIAGFARERAKEEKKHVGKFFLLTISDLGMELFFQNEKSKCKDYDATDEAYDLLVILHKIRNHSKSKNSDTRIK